MLSKTLRKAVDNGAWRLPKGLPYLIPFFFRGREKIILRPPGDQTCAERLLHAVRCYVIRYAGALA
jgi:hypothetical protein